MHKTARGMGGCVKNIIMIIIIRITSHDMTIYSPLIKKTAVCNYLSMSAILLSCSKNTTISNLSFKVGSNSTTTSLQCLCNHLTSFGGGVLVMPNKLDFNVVFNELTRIHETGNVAVLCTIIAALLLYFLVCVFARRADKKDRAKVRMNYLCLQLRSFLQQIILRLFSVGEPHLKLQ